MTNLGLVFNDVPELYDRVRPGCPPALFDDLSTLGGLRPGSAGYGPARRCSRWAPAPGRPRAPSRAWAAR